MDCILPGTKGVYSRSIPRFELREIDEERLIELQDVEFCIQAAIITDLPIVIVIKPDRIHVYNDRLELKYNAFNQDLYSKLIGQIEMILRNDFAGLVLYGYIHENEIHVYHMWDYTIQKWLGINHLGKVNLPYPLLYPSGYQVSILQNFLSEIDKISGRSSRYIIKSINNTANFFII